MIEASRRREEEKNLRIINLHAVKEFRVPGEMSTASDTQSSDGENIVDVSTGISRRRRKETTDQSVHSLQSHPLMTSVTIRQRYNVHKHVHVYYTCISRDKYMYLFYTVHTCTIHVHVYVLYIEVLVQYCTHMYYTCTCICTVH